MRNQLLAILLFCAVISNAQGLYVNPISNTDTSTFVFGGYGEILYQHMDYEVNRMQDGGAPSDNRSIVDLPRMVLSFDYKFKKGWAFSTEIEFEHGGTGSTYEYEYDESGEYEIEVEKGGEVVLEQFYLSKRINDAFNFRVGHFVVPVGVTNRSHLPTQFFGSVRSEGESAFLPLTWHETGISMLGRYKYWNYEVQLISGLDANGMTSRYWIKNARQTQYETVNMTSPAFVLSLSNNSIRSLSFNGSFYRGNTAASSSKPDKMTHIDGTVTIGSFDVEYNNKKNLIAKGNVVYGHLTDAQEIGSINTNVLSRTSPYSRTPPASNALTYSLDLGYNVFSLFNIETPLYVFGRYEYYNPMQKVEGDVFADPRYQCAVTTLGVNYFPLHNLVVKLDYAMRKVDGGNYNDENTIGLSVGYYGLFAKK